ncbi:acyl carrier protein [Streptomyces niveus]|uniref:Carrier domain-containing protein n=1 Tax=Streptomyces niveus TaxID=193462 RepID=A0A1U9QKX5_STRNV|nr:acyl carrier protein [Streptomyces niveus]AQU64928.1 hypothetical protein BBN63_00235 [Streptomyces niveus]
MPFTPEDEQRVHSLPKAEREIVLERIVLREFRVQLLMEESDELSVDENYFDLGLGSLQLTEVKEHLEQSFGCEVDTTLLFNNPTISQLLEHLDELITRSAGADRE